MGVVTTVHKELDCRQLLCPMPIIRTSKALKEIEVGQILKVIATDAGFPADIRAWTRQTGHRLVDLEEQGDEFIAYIERTK